MLTETFLNTESNNSMGVAKQFIGWKEEELPIGKTFGTLATNRLLEFRKICKKAIEDKADVHIVYNNQFQITENSVYRGMVRSFHENGFYCIMVDKVSLGTKEPYVMQIDAGSVISIKLL